MKLDSDTLHLMLLGALELSALFVVICFFLVLQNRSLKRLVAKLRERMKALVENIQHLRSSPEKNVTTEEKSASYVELIKNQLKITQEHHSSLGSAQDIVLDIDPETPLPERTAALRYALLIAEKEALPEEKNQQPNWRSLQSKYEQIFSFYTDYPQEPTDSGIDQDEIDLLNQELKSSKKRINNLEKFKALYFDLEERWQESKNKARKNYSELSEMASQVEDSEAFEIALDEYHSSFDDVGKIIEMGVEQESEETLSTEAAHGELRHLRTVAADQHKLITELQKKLKDANSAEEKEEVVELLQDELNKQMRFVQESETCIKLMEDELINANKELEQSRSKLSSLPKIKAHLKELEEQTEERDQQIYSLKSDNRRLAQKLKTAAQSPPENSDEIRKYKKAISDLQTRYAELEEKYLDLKLQ